MEMREAPEIPHTKVEKLPMWAQRLIAQQQNVISDRDAEINRLTGSADGCIATRGYDGPPVAWEGDTIIFNNGNEGFTVDAISVHQETPGRLRISGGRGISVRPSASNSITVEIDER